MASILEFYNTNKAKIAKIVDETLQNLINDDDSIFSELAPVRNYTDVILLIVKFTRSRPTIASLVGDEQELPVQRATMRLTEELLSEARIGKQYVFKNNDFKAMKRLEAALRDKQIAQAKELTNLFYGVAADLAPSIVEKMTVLLIEVLTKGSCNFTDPLTDVKFVVNYDNAITSGLNQLLFTAQPATNDRWDAPATANGLMDIDNHVNAWNRNFGGYPRLMYMRTDTLLDLKAQVSTKRALASRNGYGATVEDIAAMYVEDDQVIDLIRQRTRGAQIRILDNMYSEEATDGTISDKYFLNSNTYFFAESGNAERAFVPTPEKDFQQGIYVNTRQINDAPRQERIAGVGAGLPCVFDGRKLAAKRVK